MSLKGRVSKLVTTGFAVAILSSSLFLGSASAETGGGLNGIGSQQTQTQTTVTQEQTTQSTQTNNSTSQESTGADVVGGLFEGVGVDQQTAQKANTMMQPVARLVNLGFAVVLSIAFLGMFFITALDLLYIAFPPVRNMLYKQASSGGGMMGGGMQQSQPTTLGRWVSDEAVAVVATSQGGSQSTGGFGGGFGMGMGGYGMGGFGMGAGSQQQASTKSVILEYLKKRAFFLAMFGLCAVLLSTTIFTDLGIKLGSWILTRLIGVENNFPE